MTPERWQRIKSLLESALAREPEERAAFLKEACADDPSLQNHVQSLIASHEQAGGFIESPAFELMAESLGETQSIVGSDLGHYRVTGRLGAGGMGEVYLAEDTRLGRKVALKVLLAHFTMDEERVRRFQQEARAASALNHPSILTIYEIGQVGSSHFIVTELIEGETLRRHLSKAPITISEALDIAIQIASALSAAHAAAIVHRDIKPDNVMMRADGIVKVLDFGLAKLMEAESGELEVATLVNTRQGMVMGTAHYMSPEQARGLPVDARTDIWSLGIALYEMIGGRVPFEGATSSDVIAAILEREPTILARYAPEVPTELEWIVKKALRKDREERYQTVKELLTDLKNLKRKLEFEKELARSIDSVPGSAEIRRSPGFVSSKDNRAQQGLQVAQSHKVIDSLVILPFANSSADPGREYFSDGITESMIRSLSQLAELRVMAWSTVSRYKGREVDPRELGRDLGVDAVLTGRVVQTGERLVIKTELVNAMDGSHLWGESYSCEPSDILGIEAKISRAISEKLLVRLTTEERNQLIKHYPGNVEAYHAYLRGRYFWNKRSEEGLKKGIEHFQRAIDEDPAYAAAYAGMSDCYTILVVRYGLPSEEGIPKAKAAAMKALEIDDTLAEAHTSLAHCLLHNWEWEKAEREFKRAVELNPNDADAQNFYAEYLLAMGRVEQAISVQKRAQELDPLSLNFSTNVANELFFARRYDQAIDQCQKTLEMDHNFFWAHYRLGQAYEQKGMFEEAIAALQRAVELSQHNIEMLAALGRVLAVAGRREEARRIVDKLEAGMEHHHSWQYDIALIYAGLGEDDRAFECLEKGYEWRDGMMIHLNVEPRFDSLRSDPRFTDLLRKIGLASHSEPAEVSHSIKPSASAARSLRQPPSRRQSSRRAITSLAILPLTNTVEDPDLDYFSDGITESIINMLSQFPKLRVVARSTVFRYKGQEIDPQEVGRLLNVQAVLTGRVRQIADRLIISAELIDVANDSQLWGEHYNRNLSDIFEVQEEIAREITEKLRLKLNHKQKARLGKRHTSKVEAYQAYLKGRYHWNKRTTESLNKGVEYFKQAIDRDPGYASAYAGLCDSYTLLVVREAISPEEGFAKAKAAASMALKIDEDFAEAHASLGHAMLHNWEWRNGEKELKRAIELNPGYASAHHWYSEHLTAMGRCDESIAELKLAGGLDPLSLIISADLGRALYYAREYYEVIKQEARTLEMDPNFWLSHINLGRSYTQLGIHQDAISELRKAGELSGGNTEALSFLGFAYAVAGQTDDALKILHELNQQLKRGYVPPYHLAIVHAGLGEKDQAFEWLEQAFQKHAVDLFTLKVEPMFDSLRSDQRFEDLLKQVGLVSPEPDQEPAEDGYEREVETKAIAQHSPTAMAVLPFRPLSTAGRDEILELGIADALITKLSDLSQIIVRPTSSVRKYIDLEQDSATAGRELAVESVLEGNIQKLGDRIRITVRLVKVEDGRSLWTGKFDEEFTDIFAVEDLISEKVTAALALKLTGDDRERLKRRYTEDTAAHHLYLKGRYYWNKRTEEALNRAIECFNQAIEIDPNYALPYAGVADCYTKLGDVGVTAMLPREAFARARASAVQALRIDKSLADVHASLGHLDMHQLRWANAEKDFKRAIELNPNYATAHHWYSYYMAFHRRFEEALEEIKFALKLDPLSLPIADSVGEFLYFARRCGEAIPQFRNILEMEPNFLASRINLGRAYEQSGMFSEAEHEFVKARQIAGESIDALAALGHTYAVSGNTVAALEVLAQLIELSKERYVSPYDIALIHTALGGIEEAFRYLEKAYDEGAEWIIYTNVDPRLDPLRKDARFLDLMRRIGFVPTDSLPITQMRNRE